MMMIERLRAESGRQFVALPVREFAAGSLAAEFAREIVVEPINGGEAVLVHVRLKITARCLSCLMYYLDREMGQAIGQKMAALYVEDYRGRRVARRFRR